MEFTNVSRLLPVMVFIHGGALFEGNANRFIYNPDILLDKDVVLVTPNYRLGKGSFNTIKDLISHNS